MLQDVLNFTPEIAALVGALLSFTLPMMGTSQRVVHWVAFSFGVAAGIGLLLLGLGFLIGSGAKDDEKLSPYECGFEAFEDTRTKFDVRYYLVAILFIIFDLEIAFLFPWAVSLDKVGHFGLLSMGLFLAILVVGFIYEWKKGALEWD